MTPTRAVLDATERLLDLAIDEDLGPVGDVTSAATLDEKTRGEGTIVAKQKEGLVVCGLFAAERTFARLAPNVRFERLADDGDRLAKGKVAAKVAGPAREILGAERIALNFLQHLSGVATLTAKFVDAAAGKAIVLDTRKTTPGWRALEKFAVACGGAKNHRFGLFDGILIKDNHVEAAGGVKKAIERARRNAPNFLKIEVEVGSLEQLDEALDAAPEMILLDNFDVAGLKACVARVRKSGKKVLLEASGGVTLASIAEIAATGVDFVSSGSLTHSAPAADLSLELELAKK
ncbi:MAG TPA: carboxylating nicotinate-nucleotide diphosphorylase [bacterium]|nr:carboxylating nicotinate-nucleotide diphosphorylase [bacterium]